MACVKLRSAYWECLADRRLPVTEEVSRLLIGRLHYGSIRQNQRVEAGAMLLFCPGCGNGLIVEEGQRCHRFACNTCPYVHNITRKVSSTGGCLLCPPGGTEQASARFPQAAGFCALAAVVPQVQQSLFQWRRSGHVEAFFFFPPVTTGTSASSSPLPTL